MPLPRLDPIPGVGQAQDRRYYAITIKPTVFVNLVPSEHHIRAFHDWVETRVGDVPRSGEDLLGLTPATPALEQRAETTIG